jgi:tRNA(His) 5'-end guanylyltransferase
MKTPIMDSLGDRLKAREAASEHSIPNTSAFIVRLDGKGFSKMTRGFQKPFDPLFVNAMVKTMNDLVQDWKAATGYCHSDEITLIFRPASMPLSAEATEIPATETPATETEPTEEQPHIFNGRITKIITLLAGQCSVRFAFHLNQALSEFLWGHDATIEGKVYDQQVIDRIRASNYYFDARVLVFAPEEFKEIVAHSIWRSVLDCERNAISTYARSFFSHKTLLKKNGLEMKLMMEQKGLDWETVPLHLRYGVYCKREPYLTKVIIPSGQEVEVTRHRYINKCWKIKSTEKNLACLLAKDWTEVDSDLPIEEFRLR